MWHSVLGTSSFAGQALYSCSGTAITHTHIHTLTHTHHVVLMQFKAYKKYADIKEPKDYIMSEDKTEAAERCNRLAGRSCA